MEGFGGVCVCTEEKLSFSPSASRLSPLFWAGEIGYGSNNSSLGSASSHMCSSSRRNLVTEQVLWLIPWQNKW